VSFRSTKFLFVFAVQFEFSLWVRAFDLHLSWPGRRQEMFLNYFFAGNSAIYVCLRSCNVAVRNTQRSRTINVLNSPGGRSPFSVCKCAFLQSVRVFAENPFIRVRAFLRRINFVFTRSASNGRSFVLHATLSEANTTRFSVWFADMFSEVHELQEINTCQANSIRIPNGHTHKHVVIVHNTRVVWCSQDVVYCLCRDIIAGNIELLILFV
jgi:hypothetical protein